jgi:hypothetical protein
MDFKRPTRSYCLSYKSLRMNLGFEWQIQAWLLVTLLSRVSAFGRTSRIMSL